MCDTCERHKLNQVTGLTRVQTWSVTLVCVALFLAARWLLGF
jgi:hypothetical protein